MTRLFLIRHAEAEGNLFRRAHGHFDSLLVENGRKQLGTLKLRFEDEHIDAVYSSNLRRARATAAAVAVPRGLNVAQMPELREINLGIWEDNTWGWIEHFHSEGYNDFSNNPWLFKATDGESTVQMGQRVVGAIRQIVEDNPDKTVAVVSHGMAIRAVMSHMEYGSFEYMNKTSFGDNASVSLLEFDGDEVRIVFKNSNEHLGEFSTFERQNWWRESGRDYELWFREPDAKSDSEFVGFCKRALLMKSVNATDTTYIAMLKNDPVGMLEVDAGSTAGALGIDTLYLLEPFRSRGVGVQMLGQAISECRNHGCDRMHILVPQIYAHMKNFCEKYGFTKVSSTGKGDVLYEMRITSHSIPV